MGDIEPTLDSLAMAATANQRHVNALMGTMHHLMEMNKILAKKINQLTVTKMILSK